MYNTAKQTKVFIAGITICRWAFPGGRRFITVVDDFGNLVEVPDPRLVEY